MNERVMQFRIGVFVIVAGLVLTFMIVWFGEAPSLLRDYVYVVARFPEAPGVSEGIPVRKSGLRVGEVAAVAFEERPGMPDSVLVTLALERKYKIKAGSTPRISRALIGDVSIDLLPGSGPGLLKVSDDPRRAPIIAGQVAPDPSNALVAATATLNTINRAAEGIATLTEKAAGVDQFLTTWTDAGQNLSAASQSLDRLIKTNEANFQPAMENFRRFSENANATFDPKTQEQLKAAIDRFATASARMDQGLADLQPVLKDLGAPVTAQPTTNLGWAMLRLNRSIFEVGLLTQALADKGGSKLNNAGSLQRLLTQGDLYDNLNQMSVAVGRFFAKANLAINNFNVFAEKVARDPSTLTRGALRPQ